MISTASIDFSVVGLEFGLSLLLLYGGQSLFNDLTEQLQGSGFELRPLLQSIFDPHSEKLLQVDATLFFVH